MTTFAKPTFSAAAYASFRPTYPPALYSLLLSRHRGPRNLLLDLGTGHGLVARSLAPHFSHVRASDPSAGMVAQAMAAQQQQQQSSDRILNVSFRQARAEDELAAAKPGEADMVVAGQAAHWFDLDRVWVLAARALRKGGMVAFWCYKDHVFVDHPAASRVFSEFVYGPSRDQLGPYWEPGRKIVQANYAQVQPPEELFEDQTRVEYEPGTEGPRSGVGQVLMSRRLTIGQSMDYMRTWSSVHAWQEAHGNPRPRRDGGEEGDVVDRMYDAMREVEGPEWKSDDFEVEIEWGSAVIMAAKK
jgi:SAM-dependent methyltransferase